MRRSLKVWHRDTRGYWRAKQQKKCTRNIWVMICSLNSKVGVEVNVMSEFDQFPSIHFHQFIEVRSPWQQAMEGISDVLFPSNMLGIDRPDKIQKLSSELWGLSQFGSPRKPFKGSCPRGILIRCQEFDRHKTRNSRKRTCCWSPVFVLAQSEYLHDLQQFVCQDVSFP